MAPSTTVARASTTSDLFLTSRLQVLIDSGRIEADGPRHRLREYAIRLAEA